MPKCSVEGCEFESRAAGYCPKHYRAFKRTGDPLGKFRRSENGALSKHPLYGTWWKMHQRCESPKCISYKSYGARGIKVCDRWSDFWAFVSDMGDRPSSGHSLDRIDVNGNYEPENCRWATPAEQVRNRTVSRLKPKDLENIVALLSTGMTKMDIARQLSLDYTAVLGFTTGKNYQPNLVERAFAPVRQCASEGCDDAYYKDGLCHRHYRQLAQGVSYAGLGALPETRKCEQCDGDMSPESRPDARFCGLSCKMKWHRAHGSYTDEAVLKTRGTCAVDDCANPVHGKGMCRTHYMRQWHAERVTPEQIADREKRIALATELSKPRVLTCASCSTEFTPKRSNALYCSNRCYHTAYRKANGERIAESRRKYDNSEHGKAKKAQWVGENADYVREYKHQHYLDHKARKNT